MDAWLETEVAEVMETEGADYSLTFLKQWGKTRELIWIQLNIIIFGSCADFQYYIIITISPHILFFRFLTDTHQPGQNALRVTVNLNLLLNVSYIIKISTGQLRRPVAWILDKESERAR